MALRVDIAADAAAADADDVAAGLALSSDADDVAAPADNTTPTVPAAAAPIAAADVELLAITVVEDAWRGRGYAYRTDAHALRVYHFFNNAWLKKAISAAIAVDLALAFFEPPTYDYLLWPQWVTVTLEMLCLAVLTFRLVLMYNFLIPSRFWRDAKVSGLLAIIVLTVTDIVVNLVLASAGESGIRVTRVLRPLMVACTHRQVRRALRNIRRCLPDMVTMVSLLFIYIGVTTLAFFVLFQHSAELVVFASPLKTFYDLYCLVTVDTFPDVMMPAYRTSGWYAVLFIAFVILFTYFFMSVTLAVVYLNYRLHLKAEVRATVESRRDYLLYAFELLTQGKPTLDKATWVRVYRTLVPRADDQLAELNWRVIDVHDRGCIDNAEFAYTVDLLNLKITPESTSRNVFDYFFPRIYRSTPSRILCRFVRHWSFAAVFNTVIVANAVCVVFDWQVEPLFLSLYSLELALRLYGYGWQPFRRSAWNIYDALAIVSSVIVVIVAAITPVDNAVLDFFLCLRVLRIAKLTSMFSHYHRVVDTMIRVIPSLVVYLVVLGLLYYVYAIIGMEIWAGKLTRDNPALEGSDYAESDYFRNNFDSFDSALVVLFELMAVFSWNVLVDAFVRVTSVWARLYFVAFHITSSIVFLNILVAFILEGFVILYNLYGNEPKDRLLQRMEQLKLNIITKETEEQIWASIELGRGADGSAGAAAAAVGATAGAPGAGETDALLGLDRDGDEDDGGSGSDDADEVIQMEPVAEAARSEAAADGEAAQRLRSLSTSAAPPHAPHTRRRGRIFYRVSKRTSTVAFLERIFENELDEHVPNRPTANGRAAAAPAAPRARPPFASPLVPPVDLLTPSPPSLL